LQQLDQLIKERVAAREYRPAAINWIAGIAALPRLVTGNTGLNYNAFAARQGVLLTQLPQHLPTTSTAGRRVWHSRTAQQCRRRAL
jgi:hypothetical protein